MSLSVRGRSGLTALLCCTCLVVSFAGCKADHLTSHGTDVALLYDEPEGCENLGVVIGHGGGLSGAYSKPSINRQSAENDARNKAAELGATHLLLYPEDVAQGEGRWLHPESTDPSLAHGYGTGSNVTVAGAAYKCPPGLPVVKPLGTQTGFVEVKPPEPTSISLAPLGPIEHITVFRRVPLESGEGMAETEALRIDDPGEIQRVADSLQKVVEDPLKYIPTHRVEFVGQLGTQSLLYGFGYLQYAGKVYRLTDGAFESVLQLRDAPSE